MFGFLKNAFSKIYTQVAAKLAPLFLSKQLDESAVQEVQKILLSADAGVVVTKQIVEELKKRFQAGRIVDGAQLKDALEQLLIELSAHQPAALDAQVVLLVGVNGSGKTTFAGKLATDYAKKGKTVSLVAADTFRAAAVEQLAIWGERANAHFIKGLPSQDPAAVVFQGCELFKKTGSDILIIDTAGRLQTKSNLMQELGKIKRVINKQLPDYKICTLLTIDAMLGQNSFEQAKIFHETTNVDGLVLTKLDGTGKGGIVFRIIKELGIPIAYISCGEQADALALFNAHTYVQQLLAE